MIIEGIIINKNIRKKKWIKAGQSRDMISRSSVLPLNFNEERFAHFKLSSDLCHQHVTSKQILKATMWVGRLVKYKVKIPNIWSRDNVLQYTNTYENRKYDIGKSSFVWRGSLANCWKFVLNWSFCTLLVPNTKVHPALRSPSIFKLLSPRSLLIIPSKANTFYLALRFLHL